MIKFYSTDPQSHETALKLQNVKNIASFHSELVHSGSFHLRHFILFHFSNCCIGQSLALQALLAHLGLGMK